MWPQSRFAAKGVAEVAASARGALHARRADPLVIDRARRYPQVVCGPLGVDAVIAGLVGVGWPLDDRSALRLDGVVERRDGPIGVPGYLRFSTSVAWTNKLSAATARLRG